MRGETSRANLVPDWLKIWTPQATTLEQFLGVGTRPNGDLPDSSHGSGFTVNIDGPGIVASKRPDNFFNVAVDFTNPGLVNASKVLEPSTPDYWIVSGTEAVFSEGHNNRQINSQVVRVVGSSSPATDLAHGVVLGPALGLSGFTETTPPYANSPMYNVSIGVKVVGLQKITNSPIQSISSSIKLTELGDVLVTLSDTLLEDAALKIVETIPTDPTVQWNPLAVIPAGTKTFLITMTPNGEETDAQTNSWGGMLVVRKQPTDSLFIKITGILTSP